MKKVLLKLKEIEPNYWEFEEPFSLSHFDERLDEGIDFMNAGLFKKAEKIFRSIIKEFPEHIDAFHHLALLNSRQEKNEIALIYWEMAVEIGMKVFPENFVIGKDILDWSVLENRPFLRAYYGLGFAFLEKGDFEKALITFLKLLSINPGDNQSARGMIVACSFGLMLPEEVIRVCDKYPNDFLSDLLYGRSLALFQLNKMDKAKESIIKAIKHSPLIAEELLKTIHRKPNNMREGYITLRGTDEAYYYWKRFGKYWKSTKGAIDFAKQNLEKKHNNSFLH